MKLITLKKKFSFYRAVCRNFARGGGVELGVFKKEGGAAASSIRGNFKGGEIDTRWAECPTHPPLNTPLLLTVVLKQQLIRLLSNSLRISNKTVSIR